MFQNTTQITVVLGKQMMCKRGYCGYLCFASVLNLSENLCNYITAFLLWLQNMQIDKQMADSHQSNATVHNTKVTFKRRGIKLKVEIIIWINNYISYVSFRSI